MQLPHAKLSDTLILILSAMSLFARIDGVCTYVENKKLPGLVILAEIYLSRSRCLVYPMSRCVCLLYLVLFMLHVYKNTLFTNCELCLCIS